MISLDTITTGQCSHNALNPAFFFFPFGLQFQALIEGTCSLLTQRSRTPIDSHVSVWMLSVLTWRVGGSVLFLQGSARPFYDRLGRCTSDSRYCCLINFCLISDSQGQCELVHREEIRLRHEGNLVFILI